MRHRTVLLVGGFLAASIVAAGVVSVRWWRRQHSFGALEFHPPVVAAAVPARLRLVPVVKGLDRPTDIQFVPGGGSRAVVLEQGGHARLVDLAPALSGLPPVDGHAAPLVLDIWVRSLGEMGLLGFAFHPRYPERPLVYVCYGPWLHDILRTRIAEFTLPSDRLGKSPAVETRVLLEIEQKVAVHQGGQVAFGKDGKLYVAIGDGGTANDPDGNAQNLGSLHGKLLRLDVDTTTLAPADNPFVKVAGARPEVWAYGLRNPWRFSFDPEGRAIVGDVGQEAREEVDLVTAGANLGWNQREGRICSQTSPHCPTAGLTEPIFDYDRVMGSSVTGGYIATGTRVPELTGQYVFADFVRGRIWSMRLPATAPAAGSPPSPATNPRPELLGQWPRLFSAFGRDAAGDLYVADVATGEVLALMPLK